MASDEKDGISNLMHTIAVSLPSLSNFPCSTGHRGTLWAPGCGHGSEISIMARRQIACSPLPQACLALLQANSTSDQIEVAAHSGWRPLTGTGRKISHCPYGGNYRPSAQWRKGSEFSWSNMNKHWLAGRIQPAAIHASVEVLLGKSRTSADDFL